MRRRLVAVRRVRARRRAPISVVVGGVPVRPHEGGRGIDDGGVATRFRSRTTRGMGRLDRRPAAWRPRASAARAAAPPSSFPSSFPSPPTRKTAATHLVLLLLALASGRRRPRRPRRAADPPSRRRRRRRPRNMLALPGGGKLPRPAAVPVSGLERRQTEGARSCHAGASGRRRVERALEPRQEVSISRPPASGSQWDSARGRDEISPSALRPRVLRALVRAPYRASPCLRKSNAESCICGRHPCGGR